MKTLLTLLILLVCSVGAYGECTNEMQAFNNHQNVINGMMNMNFQGKLNSENSKAIGERMQKGQEASNNGDYAKACEIYDSIIEDYGMEKVFGVQQEGGQETQEPQASEEAVEATASGTSTAAPAEESSSASPDGN